MKKLPVFLCALCMICCGAFFTGCSSGPGYSETFAGTLSEHSYTSSNKAAEGFLSEELTGAAEKAEFVSYVKQRDMTKEQISGLDVSPLGETEQVVAAEVGNITYKTIQTSNYSYEATAESPQSNAVFTVYILEISRGESAQHEYRYYVPKSEPGQSLTNSYYKDLFNPEKYTDFTQKMTYTSTVSMGTSINKTAVVKVNANKALIETDEKYIYPNTSNWADMPSMDNHIVAYIEESAGNMSVWESSNNGTFNLTTVSQMSIAGITDIKSLPTLFLPGLDFSYYEKTSYGFKIKNKYLRYISASLGSLMGLETSVNAQLNFYVVEGRLYKIEETLKATYGIGSLNSTTTIRQDCIFTDYGTTVVNKPAGIE